MEWLSDPSAWVALCTLTVLEIVLGIDNLVFISILSGKLPEEQRAKARQIGLMLALVTRVLLLLSIKWVMGLTKVIVPPLTASGVFSHGLNGKDLVLLGGGLFLIYKAVKEIHHKLEGAEHEDGGPGAKVASMASVILQILILDIVFSLDSVITAVGMADQIPVMITAVVIALIVMLAFAGKISDFVERHPTVKMLALAFLVLIGVNLVAEGAGQHIEKGFTYFAMAFATVVEMLNLKLRAGKAVKLKGPETEV